MFRWRDVHSKNRRIIVGAGIVVVVFGLAMALSWAVPGHDDDQASTTSVGVSAVPRGTEPAKIGNCLRSQDVVDAADGLRNLMAVFHDGKHVVLRELPDNQRLCSRVAIGLRAYPNVVHTMWQEDARFSKDYKTYDGTEAIGFDIPDYTWPSRGVIAECMVRLVVYVGSPPTVADMENRSDQDVRRRIVADDSVQPTECQ